ncbi:hypothetical protein Golomagni_05995 [Golovinomyces magnicellulatus]|nr:hypothetical protein Golomagni_05995 [Golovinomyces magnicellulatus]
MTSLYEDTKQRQDRGDKLDHNLMTLLVQGSQDDNSNGTGLTEAEIYGNMFVVTFAGHDTSALTFVYSIFFLAAHPEIQEWVSEEIQEVLQGRNPSELDYNRDFHRLKRCVAVMYETLRLYTIVPTMKWTGNKAAPLIVNGETYVIPAETVVTTSWGAVQTDPRYWGSNSLAWNPRRWIKQSETISEKPNPGAEEFLDYKRGTFVGWSGGARDCPGRQFSQAEFVATMAVLFSDYRVEAVKNPGETNKMARDRVMDVIENDTGAILLTQIMHPERVPLYFHFTVTGRVRVFSFYFPIFA